MYIMNHKNMIKIYRRTKITSLIIILYLNLIVIPSIAQAPFIPSHEELNRAFGYYDYENFNSPPKVFSEGNEWKSRILLRFG